MKKVITFIAVALLALCVKPAHAQEEFIDPIGDQIYNGDLKNLYLIWWSTDAQDWYGPTTDQIAGDFRPNGDYATDGSGTHTGNIVVQVWESTLVGNDATLNANAALGDYNGGYIDWSVSPTATNWSGGGFCLDPPAGDPTQIDFTGMGLHGGNYRFHLDIRKSNPQTAQINLYGMGGSNNGETGASFQVGDPNGAQQYSGPNLTPNFVVNEWQVIDIPVSDLHALGWDNLQPFIGNFFTFLPGSSTGQNLAFDAIFFYEPTNSGINGVNANKQLNVVVTDKTVNVLNAKGPIDVYNLAGVKVKTYAQPVFGVDEVSKGAYIIKSGSAVAKVIIR